MLAATHFAVATGPRRAIVRSVSPTEALSMKPAVKIRVNGTEHQHEVEPRVLLVHFLRDLCGLTGTHVGCETSICGACTVLVDGKAVKSCTVFAVQADGAEVTTIEGLARDGELH